MGNMKFDSLMKRIRGKVGNYVFRKTRGKMIISSAPDFEAKEPTQPQLAVRETFRQAAAYSLDRTAALAGFTAFGRSKHQMPRRRHGKEDRDRQRDRRNPDSRTPAGQV